MPTLSVLMPVYNAERYLAEAMESILQQTFTDFEFLIINDGSTDRSLSILQRYAAEDPRIRLVSRANTGYVQALNEMLALAEGEFIARMDADDISLPNRFAHQVEFLQQQPDVVCVGGAQAWIDEAGRFLSCLSAPQEDSEIQRLALAGHTPINHPSAMMRRSAVLQIGGYDPNLCPAEDLDLWLRLGEIGKLANLSETVLKYRQHDQSVSERQHATQTQQKRKACENAWQRRGIAGHFEATDPWRPGKDRKSRHQFMMQYGWWAFNSGERQTALVYSWKAIQALPTHLGGWKLLLSALVKPIPAQTKPSEKQAS